MALIGAGGIGKTSIALNVLHHDRIKAQFGDNRRFIRCDQFPASRAHLLRRLSKVIGAGIDNPEDLTPLRRFLSSTKMILFLDNAESILDPAGPDVREIYAVVEELTRFDNICLGITSRISTVPPQCKRPTIPTLSMESACDIFYGIYDNGGRSDIINDLVRRLDFHALSITLLATVASHNTWDYDRLAKEWETQRGQVLQMDHSESLAATIELSLASQTFRQLISSPSSPPSSSSPRKSLKSFTSSVFHKFISSSTPHKLVPRARELLEVVAFFPQGVNEGNLDWLFPTMSDINHILDKFCTLSLTYRSNGFITMLAPIRDYLVPRNPQSSPLLCATKDRYLSRLSVNVDPSVPGFEKAKWIASEDVNVEHLLDVFTSIDPTADDVLDGCYYFMEHLFWYKPRETVLRPKIQALSDGHPAKPKCLFELSRLFGAVGNYTDKKRLLTHTLRLERERGGGMWTAHILKALSVVNRNLGLPEEGIQRAKEALEIYERFGCAVGQADSLLYLASSFFDNKQLDAAESNAFRSIDKDDEYITCKSHRLLGNIYRSKGEKEKAIHHFETALQAASRFKWQGQLIRAHHGLAVLFLGEDQFDDANTHIERAKQHAVNDVYFMGRAMRLQAEVWYKQGRLEDARSEVSCALEVFEKLGSTKEAVTCVDILEKIERGMKSLSTLDTAVSFWKRYCIL